MKCGFFQWLILAKLDQNKMTKVWEIDQTVPRLKYFLFQLFLWWSVSTLRCSLKCQQSPDQWGWDPVVLSHDEDPLKRNFLWRFYWIVIKHLTLGNIVPCLRPVSSDLNTLVTSSSSLLVNSSGWLVMLLLIYGYVNLYICLVFLSLVQTLENLWWDYSWPWQLMEEEYHWEPKLHTWPGKDQLNCVRIISNECDLEIFSHAELCLWIQSQ